MSADRTQWKKAYHANCWGPLGGNAMGVTSITQLTYQTFGDMGRAFDDIASAGYTGVEMFDGNLLESDAATLRSQLDNAGLALVAAYSGANFIFEDILDEEFARLTRAADRAAELGAEHFVVGGGAKRAAGTIDDDYAKLARQLDRVVDLASERGLTAQYHPHLSTIVEGPDEVRRVFEQTRIHFCPDTAHLAAAGGDPAALIREHAKRINYVHLKGWQREPFAFTPLDTGDLAIDPIVDAMAEIAFDGWVLIELDAWPDPKAGAIASMNYLKNTEARLAQP